MTALLREDAGGVATLTLNRPERRNALTVELLERLVGHLAAIRESAEIGAVVLTGAGGTFCAGADLSEFADRPEDPGRQHRIDLVTESMERLRDLPQPTIAAVAGAAYGAGWGLALACDLTHATSSAGFSLPEVAKGLRLPDAITSRLVDVVGPVRAAEIVLGGERRTGADGLAGGWVSRTLPDAAAVAESAADLARTLAMHPADALGGVTRALRRRPAHEPAHTPPEPSERGEQ